MTPQDVMESCQVMVIQAPKLHTWQRYKLLVLYWTLKGLLVPFLFLADKTEVEVYAQFVQQRNKSKGLMIF